MITPYVTLIVSWWFYAVGCQRLDKLKSLCVIAFASLFVVSSFFHILSFFLHPSHLRVFGFVAKKPGSTAENVCHLFAELDPDQPASAIVNFINKVMLSQRR